MAVHGGVREDRAPNSNGNVHDWLPDPTVHGGGRGEEKREGDGARVPTRDGRRAPEVHRRGWWPELCHLGGSGRTDGMDCRVREDGGGSKGSGPQGDPDPS